jgi:ABC-type tungstate transport system permease subunit
MFSSPTLLDRPARLAGPRGRSGIVRRLIAVPVMAIALVAFPAVAGADSSSTLTVIGTSDVSDSGLMPNLIQPGFEKAFPQFTFKYTGTATGTAIANSESGAAGASVLIVHAPSLENQFVASGYAYEKYGRALFINDFVLGGPNADPAGVSTQGANNIVQAFATVAAAGGGGKATFVSRGGTPGTTVQEHAIWQLVSSSGLSPGGLLLCTVNDKSGGGETPIAAGHGVTASGQPCPNSGALPTGSALPSWYAATGLTQGPNVQAADTCNGFPSGPNSCYVFTDRGTFDYLASGTDPAGSLHGLKIVTRDNGASAPGGANELVNYFHGYVINPAKPGQQINLPAAQDFLNYITSPAVQAQIKGYLAHTSDPGGAPFKPTASPTLSSSKIPRTYHAAAGKKLKVTGTLTNAQPGYPVLSGKQVTIDELIGGLPVSVATGKTDSKGKYSISFVPPSTGSYELTTPQITQIEDTKLNPVFGDLLSPSATTPVKVTVHSAITKLSATSQGGQALIRGQVSPGSGQHRATVTILARPQGSKKGFKKVATDKLAANDANFAAAVKLSPGKWSVKVQYGDKQQVVAAQARTAKVTVGAKPTVHVKLTSVKVAHGSVTVSGAITPAGKATIGVLAMKTAGGAPKFGQKATVKVSGGKGRFTAHIKLKGGSRWVLQLAGKQGGVGDSGLKTVAVK